ncbi:MULTISPECIES: MFS transporter [Acetobacter]|uniref:MFS transporter n=1 Tax=Acetobacter thailandicus TaxID=1502842 RepID=A0ABT3QCQ1_9PROT|nr:MULTISPECIES: MFS transporter [Acetobacter]MBS0961262.1 MFS transporter [Acetobacter thailandicus]MBS0979479.1 MFS transporter [Acetobacter thailandicus]MBS0986665.1 MFS transporter [Acetobacter thailandicus]MCX2563051.1 MFS transporter [Acetobacter thailandicus]
MPLAVSSEDLTVIPLVKRAALSAPRRYFALAAVTALYFFLMAGSFNALGVVLPAMVSDLHLNWSEAGFGFTLLGLACGLISPLPAITIRHFGIVATLISAGCLLASGFAFLAMAVSKFEYDLGTLLIGCAFTLGGTVPGTYVVANLFEQSSRPMGLYFGIGGLGSIAGPLLYIGINSTLHGWRPFWWFCALATSLCSIIAALIVHGIPFDIAHDNTIRKRGWPARTALRSPAFWVIVTAYTGCLAISTTLHSFSVKHFTEHGLSATHAAEIMSMVALLAAAGAFIAGEAGRVAGGRILTGAATAALMLASATLLMPQSSLTLGVFIVTMGLGVGLSYVASAMLLLEYFGTRHNLELYATMCLISTAAAFGPWLGGLIHDSTGSFRMIFMAFAAIGLLLTLALAFLRRPSLQDEA